MSTPISSTLSALPNWWITPKPSRIQALACITRSLARNHSLCASSVSFARCLNHTQRHTHTAHDLGQRCGAMNRTRLPHRKTPPSVPPNPFSILCSSKRQAGTSLSQILSMNFDCAAFSFSGWLSVLCAELNDPSPLKKKKRIEVDLDLPSIGVGVGGFLVNRVRSVCP